jgi:hypothetical protein
MAPYLELKLDDFKGTDLRRITPRDTADLPFEITGTGAFWYAPQRTQRGNLIPPSYAVKSPEDPERNVPIEFINNTWYQIDWDDSATYKGYWVHADRNIAQGIGNTGWLGSQRTPISGGSLFQTRERAESASTQPEPEAVAAEEEDDPVDTNPALTERLAATFEDNPIFEDIAEANDPPQDRTHYLPTTVPIIRTLRPVGVNPRVNTIPLLIRSGREENLAAAVDPSETTSNSVRLDGSLKGKLPEPFDGDRTKTQRFLNAFKLFWMNNEDNSHMKNPYKRSTFFLGLFNGGKVDDWVEDQTEQLRNKTIRRSDRISKGDETLWSDLLEAFERAYAHTGRVEQARIELNKLEMDSNMIDDYIAKFENLLRKAEIPRTEVGSIQKFKDGLKRTILSAILRRDTWPETIDEWQDHARREVRRLDIVKEALGDSKSPFTSKPQINWQNIAQRFKSVTPPKKRSGVVPMEIDAVRLPDKDSAREAERIKLQKEGRCFFCKETGHFRFNCTKKPKKPQIPSAAQKARSTTTEPSQGIHTPDLEAARRIFEVLTIDEINAFYQDGAQERNKDF